MTAHHLRALGLALALGLATPVSSAPLIHLSIEELSARSDACVLARVVGEEVHWNEAGTLIVTTFTLQVEESLAGTVGSGPILLHRLGGELDGMALGYEGMPELEVDGRAVVFMMERAPGAYIVSSLRQGILRQGGEHFVRDLRDVVGAPEGGERLSLDELRTRLRAAAGSR